jgi:hypothetical protein
MNSRIKFKLFATVSEYKYTKTDKADTQGNGTSTKRLEKAKWFTLTAVNIEAVLLTVKNMATVTIYGLNQQQTLMPKQAMFMSEIGDRV